VSNIYPGKKKELYDKYLGNISNIRFTAREVDILSCIYHRRGEKKIGSILDISHRTVGAHVRNIMAKLGNSTRDYVIDFIEKSGNLNYLKEYYLCLIIEGTYKKQLDNIRLINRNGTKVSILKSNKLDAKEASVIEQIKEHLNRANINYVESDKINNDENLIHLNYDLSSVPEIESIKIINLRFNKSDNIDPTNIDFTDQNNFYESVLKLISAILENPKIESIIKEYKIEVISLQESFAGNNSSHKEDNKQGARNIKKILLLPFIIGVTIILAFCFVFYRSNSSIGIKHNESVSWNLPVEFAHFTDRPDLVKAVWDKLENNNTKRRTAFIIGVHGLGGIGKTTLANRLIHNPKKKYQFRAWFSAETEELLENNYFDLGTKYNLFNQTMGARQRLIAVKEWLENQGDILLVYDNAPNIESVKNYLPNKGDIIVTSRNYKLPNAIEVDVMNEQQSIALLDNLLPDNLKKDKGYNAKLQEITKKLGYLPLALSQAGAYIDQNKITLSQYLALYDSEKHSLLNDKTMPALDNHGPVYVTWDMSIKELHKLKGGGDALEILDFASYCYPENIPKKLLSHYLYGNSNEKSLIKLNRALLLLRNFSLVKLSEDSISIHRLVHIWSRSKHSKEKFKEIFIKAAKAFKGLYPKVEESTSHFVLVKMLLPHMEEFIRLNNNISSKDSSVLEIKTLIADAYYTFTENIKARDLFEYILEERKKNPLQNQDSLAELMHRLGKIYRNLGKFQESQKILEEALNIRTKKFGNNHLQTASTLHQLGKLQHSLGNYQKSMLLLKQSKSIKESIVGPNHIELSFVLEDLGKAYCAMGHFSKNIDTIKRALSIKEKHFQSNHFEIAYTLDFLGRAYHKSGKYDDAMKVLQKSLKIKRIYLSDDHLEMPLTLHEIGATYRKMGKYKKSLEYLEQALEIIKKYSDYESVIPYLESYYIHYQLGVTHNHLGNYEKSKEYLEKSLYVQEKYYGSEHIEIAYVLDRLGDVYIKLKDKAKAKSLYDKALNILKNSNVKGDVIKYSIIKEKNNNLTAQ